MEIGVDYIATGHYANVVKLDNGRYAIKKSKTQTKDQTYALYNLTQAQLSHTLMPIGAYEKDEIRRIAEEIGLNVANKPDSQEICFIPDHDYGKYIKENMPEVPGEGNFVTADGTVLGKHKGIYHYTVGQRRGLGLAMGYHVFVSEIRPETNEVVIGTNEDIMSDRLYANQLNFMSVVDITEDTEVSAKIRYNHSGAKAVIRKIDRDLIECIFEKPQRAITPGQAVVFYDGNLVLGGGTIIGTKKENLSL